MSENFQNPSFLGTPHFLQLSLPVVSNAAPLTGSDCNFSRVPAQPVSSAWLLPSASGTSFQPAVGSAYLYQHSSTTMLPEVSGQSQISTSAASYPGIFEWDMMGSTEEKSSSLDDIPVTVTDEDTAVFSMPISTQYDKTSDNNTRVPPHPSLSASLVQGTAFQNPNPGNSLSLHYQEGTQIYYYNQGTLGPLLTGDHDPCLQSCGSVSHTGGRASAFQQEMVMVLGEVQPTNGLPPASTSRIYHSVSAQLITEANFQVMETSLRMETSLGLQLPSQTFCLSQTTEFSKSCSSRNIQIFESNPPSELGDISMRTPIKNSGHLLALPPAPSQEQRELDEIKTMLSKPLEAYQVTTENQDSPPLLPIHTSDIHQLLACIDPLGQEEQSCPGKPNLGKHSMGLEDQGTFDNGMESSSGLADTATLVEDVHLPQLFSSLKDFDQSEGPKATKAIDTKTIKANQVQKKSSVIKGPSEQTRKNKHKASDTISGAPKAKIHPKNPDCLLEEEVFLCNAAASDKALTAKTSNSKPQETACSRNSKTKGHRQEKTKRSGENNSKKAEESKKTGNKVKGEEKPTIPKRKRKTNQPEFSQENFKKPQSGLGMHLLESMHVLHALGKKSDKKTGLPSSQTLGHSNNTKDHRPPPAIKPGLDTPCEGKGLEKTHVKAQKAEGSAEKECSSPSQYELPPPGKVKLIPLPFLTIDKPPTRPVPRRPQTLASRRPSVAHPAQAGSTSSAQPPTVNPSWPTPASASWAGSARPAQDLDESKGPKATKAKDTEASKANQLQEKSSIIKGPSGQTRKKKRKASHPISGAPKAKIHPKNPECLLKEEMFPCSAAASNKTLTAKASNSKPQKTASSTNSKTKGHGQEKTKSSRENNSEKAEESKQSASKGKGEEKPTISKMKRKKNLPELSRENSKKPRSGLGMHMLESVQLSPALGKKTDKKTGLPSSQTLGHSNTTKDHRPPPAIKPRLDTPHVGKRPEKTQVKAQKAEGSAEKECSSPSQYELPPPGKVKSITLPFLNIVKPPTWPIPRKPQTLASRQSSVAHPAQPGSTSSAEPTAVNPSWPTPASASWAGSARPARPISTNPTRPGLNNPTQPSVPQSAASRPAPYRTSSCASFQREPVPTAGTKLQSPPKPQNQFLHKDFSSQPKPWRKPNVPELVMSKRITEEPRPRHEAMKRKAQQEPKNAAKYTSRGKVQFFIQREKDMEIAQYYGYPI